MSEAENIPQGQKRTIKMLVFIFVILLVVGYIVFGVWATYKRKYLLIARSPVVCGSTLSILGKALEAYANGMDTMRYPTPEKWCDLLTEHYALVPRQFTCMAAEKEGNIAKCHYAMNPNCEPNSPNDVVLLFETKGGWNQRGGAEILTTENHGGKGCNVLFNDGSVRFVRAEELGTLKWNVEAKRE